MFIKKSALAGAGLLGSGGLSPVYRVRSIFEEAATSRH